MASRKRHNTLVKPRLFSQAFPKTAQLLKKEGLFDPILNSDSKLFIDPLLLEGSTNRYMKGALANFEKHFSNSIKLLAASQKVDDPAWKAARKFVNLDERSETCLGYGGSNIRGSSRSRDLQNKILNTTKEIITLGSDEPQIVSMMAMFEEGVGPDTISDMTTTAILSDLCELTEDFCNRHNIKSRVFTDYHKRKLPENPFDRAKPIILVPRDILRDLPLAADWSDVSRVALENEKIRDAFNSHVGLISQATLTEKKEALKRAALSSLKNFQTIFNSVIGSSDSYDPNADPLNLYHFRDLISGDTAAFKQAGLKIGPPSSKELSRVVTAVLDHFRMMVEQNNLWELLWHKDQPKRERAAQLLFFAVADVFCKANNIDISPETNSGGGPVDFKFSTGYSKRLIVEIKLSKGRVVHGYKTQVGIYQTASDAEDAIFLIIDVNGMGDKLRDIRKFEKSERDAGRKTAKIVVIDGRRRESASVRGKANDTIEDHVTEGDDDED
ncbi:hypothetical protein [Agrobacterium sp. RS6]|uniref:hypothetical protein n=1 Tax=Agrobacterium sp. RS6 TaxID=2489001 RepID=UPI000FDD1878|nr:hypothetical protein [Agrobacterium sp. RS6]